MLRETLIIELVTCTNIIVSLGRPLPPRTLGDGRVHPEFEVKAYVGIRNFLLFQEVAFAQSFMMPIETEQFEIKVNFPFLIVSTSKSVIVTKTAAVPTVCLPLIAVPIGGFRVGDFDIDPNIVPLLRCYVENVRNGNWQLDSEAEEFAAQQISELTSADQDLRPADIAALLIINELNSVSMGLETITAESWQQSLDIFLGMVALQRANL
jgi:hypothetical protein